MPPLLPQVASPVLIMIAPERPAVPALAVSSARSPLVLPPVEPPPVLIVTLPPVPVA
jgi:hypothetical protein